MNREVLELAAALHRRHRPFVLATVVWSRAPSSGKQGGAALIEMDGTVHGWIGGACAEPTVLREARHVISDGEPRLLYLGPADEIDGRDREGVVAVPIACASEGALEVFMEPVLPQPQVVIVGRSPAVKTLARLLAAMDWRAIVVDDEADALDLPAEVRTASSVESLGDLVDDATAVLVATQGHYDEPALEAALATEASYIGLVASARRAENVLGYLRDRGHDALALERIETPAGIDLGHIEHREIAVAVLGRLVELRASGAIAGTTSDGASAEPATAIDPVCGMTVDVAGAKFTAELEGETYYFCCPACRKMFEDAPAEYVGA